MVELAMAIVWFLAGAGVEVLNALTRKWTVDRLHNLRSIGWVAGGLVVRLVLTSAVLVLAFRYSPLSGLAALLGYWIGRWTMIWRVNRQLARPTG